MPILAAEPMIYPLDLLDEQAIAGGGIPSASNEPPRQYDGGTPRWLVAHTRPRQEKALARYLLTRRIPYYLPQSTRVTRHRERPDSWVPIFPGYLFLKTTANGTIEALQSNRIAAMLNVPDPRGLVEDLQRVKRLIDSKLPLYQEDQLTTGQTVRISAGPLLGMTGIIESRPGPYRFIVAVNFIGQGVSVEVEARALEPLDAEDAAALQSADAVGSLVR